MCDPTSLLWPGFYKDRPDLFISGRVFFWNLVPLTPSMRINGFSKKKTFSYDISNLYSKKVPPLLDGNVTFRLITHFVRLLDGRFVGRLVGRLVCLLWIPKKAGIFLPYSYLFVCEEFYVRKDVYIFICKQQLMEILFLWTL